MSILHLGSTTAVRRSTAVLRLHLQIPILLGQETAIGPGCLQAKPLRTGTQNLVDGPQWTHTAILPANGATPTGSPTEMTRTIVPGTVRGSTSATHASPIATLRRPHGKRARSASAGARTPLPLPLPPTCLPRRARTSRAPSARGSQTRTPTSDQRTRGTTAPPPGTTPRARTRASARAAPAPARSAGARRATTCAPHSSALETTRSLRRALEPCTTRLLRTATSRATPRRRPRGSAGPRRPLGEERTMMRRGTTRVPGARGSMRTRGRGSRGTMRGATRPPGGCLRHGRRRRLRRRMGGPRTGGTIGGTLSRRAGDCAACVWVCVMCDVRACSFGSALVIGS